MKKNIKTVCILAAVTVLFFFISCCFHKNSQTESFKTATGQDTEIQINTKENNSFPTLVVAYPTSAVFYPEDLEMVEHAVNEIVQEKLKLHVDFVTLGDNYEEVINTFLAGQQQLDIMFCSGGMMSEMMMNDQLCQLDDLLVSYGQGIIEAVGSDIINTCRINGKLYGLPNNRDYAVGWDGYILQKDILDKYGIRKEDITSIEKLEELFALVKKHEPEMEILDCDGFTILGNQYYLDNVNTSPIGVHMDYGRDYQLTNVFQTEEYKEALERVYRWRQLGYIKRDFLGMTSSIESRMSSGRLFAYACRGKPGIEQQEKLSCGRDVVFVQFGENAVIGNSMAAMPWVITKNTLSAEKSMKLLNLFYTDADIMNLFSYGIEGIHYVKTADGHITFPKGKNINPFYGEAWRMPNQFITYVWEGIPLTLWEDIRTSNRESLHGCDFGFNFDPTSVSTEYLELERIYEEYRLILENGLVDPKEGLAEMNKELEANFIDDVIAEKQRQFDEFIEQSVQAPHE